MSYMRCEPGENVDNICHFTVHFVLSQEAKSAKIMCYMLGTVASCVFNSCCGTLDGI